MNSNNNSSKNSTSNNNSGNRNSNNSNSHKSNGVGSHQLEQQQEDQPAFNPFELQGLNDLLAASGQFDMNNPLAGFMAAALAAQGQAGGAFGAGLPPSAAAAAFNPFLMPPFGAPPTRPI